jgi:hypothetical protein
MCLRKLAYEVHSHLTLLFLQWDDGVKFAKQFPLKDLVAKTDVAGSGVFPDHVRHI